MVRAIPLRAMRRGVSSFVSCFAIVAFSFSPSAFAQGPPATPVIFETMTRQTVQERRRVTGEVRARRTARVATREAGLVVTEPLRAGRTVDAGTVLVRLDTTVLDLERTKIVADDELAKSLVDERRAELEQAERDLEALERLSKEDASNPKEVLDARTEVVRAKARVTQEERRRAVIAAELALLDRRIADMEIKAPFPGTITQTLVEAGDWVGEGDAVLELVSAQQVEVWLAVPERFRSALEGVGASIGITVPATGRTVSSRSFRIVPLVSSNARNFPVVVDLDPAPPGTTPGMSITAEIPTGEEREHSVIPRDAISRSDTGLFVYQVVESQPGQSMVLPVSVELLFTIGDQVVINSSLPPDAKVVVEGNERLYPHAAVTPMPRQVKSSAGKKGAAQ